MQVRESAIGAAVLLALLTASTAHGQAAKGLDSCQRTAAKEGVKLAKARTKAVGGCLQKISKELIKENDPTVAGAAKSCAAQMRKLVNSEQPSKELDDRARLKIAKACDPATNPALPHTSPQVLDLVPPFIKAKNLDAWCANFGGDGSIATISEWQDCIVNASHCQADQQVSVEYPRALEWLDAIRVEIANLGMEAKYTDALAAVDALKATLDAIENGELDLNCGPGLGTCGDNVVEGFEHCDGSDLDSSTCNTLGFIGGTLGCTSECFFDISSCISGAFPVTGQTVSYGANDDGALQVGALLDFDDNGNGTITDQNSGLMWEKKSNDDTINDVDNTFEWADLEMHVDALNNATFGGHDDWRIPNRNELDTLLNFGTENPAVTSDFNNGCSGGCTVLTCSCTDSNPYWSSTTYDNLATQAWVVHFSDGRNVQDPKNGAKRVRAVRGGL